MKASRKFLLKAGFAFVSIALLFSFVPLPAIAGVLAGASLPWSGAGMALQFASRAVATFRMQVVAANQGLRLSRRRLYAILLASQYYGLFLPGGLAGGAAWVKYLQHGAGKAAAAAVVVTNRAIAAATVVAMGAAAWWIDHADGGWLQFVVPLALLAALAAGVILWPPRAAAKAGPPRPATLLLARLQHLRQRLMLFRHLSRRQKLVALTSAGAETLLNAAVIWCFANAVGAGIGLIEALWVRAALVIMMMLPITIAGIGVREASLIGLGDLLGVPPTQAVAWSFMTLAGTIVVGVVGGLIEAQGVGRAKTPAAGRRKRGAERGGDP